ncbi:MAG: amidohydrolase 2, partial [Bryobacterales bacterium]|nr:amidohydrolase 2 [Bryobacterales bacterium]
KAIDNHAHPVRVMPKGQQDRFFDALPVDHLEPASDPLALRPGAFPRMFPQGKQSVIDAKGDQYPEWVLDQMNVDVMLANRVEMGKGIGPPRFRWVPYADALLFPLNNASLASENSDKKAFFALEDALLRRYLTECGLSNPPGTLADYLSQVVTPTLERHKRGGAVAEKFEAAYLRSLAFDQVARADADRAYRGQADYKMLQDYLFRFIAAECGRLGMAVHIHTMAGAGGYFSVAGANPLLLEPVLNDPALRKTRFVMLHGGWPFTREITALVTKPNAYLDFSEQSLVIDPPVLAQTILEWLSFVPEKVLFATDAYPFSDELGWEESGWIAARRGREALGIALTTMMRNGTVSRERAKELAGMVMRENARKLYGL